MRDSNLLKKQIIQLTQHLIKMKTESSNLSENSQGLFFVKNLIGGRVLINPHTKQKVLLWKPVGKHFFWLGHIDVVPGEKKLFEPIIKGNRLFGRGSYDMKGSLASFIFLLKKQPQLRNKIGFLITSDEELGGINGASWIINSNKLKINDIKGVVVGEPTDLRIATKSKGLLILRVHLLSRSAHASQPWLGSNAIESACEVVRFFQKTIQQPSSEKDWKTSFNIGMLKIGTSNKQLVDSKIEDLTDQTNIIPNKAEIGIDIRFTNKSEPKHIINKLEDFLKRMEKENKILDFRIVTRMEDPGEFIDPNNLFVKNFISSGKKAGLHIEIGQAFGASDGRFFIKKDKRIPLIRFGPKGKGAHSDCERVDINSLLFVFNVLKVFITSN